MAKCSNFVCLNEVKGGHKYTEAFCKSCRLSSSPFVYECNICKTAFSNNKKSGQIPLSCSDICKKKWRSVKREKEYRKKNPFKKKECPICRKDFRCKKRITKYCSTNCRNTFKRIHKLKKMVVEYQKKIIELVG